MSREVQTKIAQVRAYLKAQKLDGAVFLSRSNFAWLSGGGDNHIVSQDGAGVGALVVTKRQALVVANRIELGRLTAEEGLEPFTPKVFPWIQGMGDFLKKTLPKGRYAADTPGLGFDGLPGDFSNTIRCELQDAEIRRYKALGRDCALVVETVCRQVAVGDSEFQIESEIARHALARGIQPYVALVAVDERVRKFRHPTPTAKKLRKHAMLVLCGQRHGLIANLTRFVHFGPLPADLVKRHAAVLRVEAAYWDATVPGQTWGSAFAAAQRQYKAEGFADEWQLHHQGGPTGYTGRDIIVTPGEKRLVHDRQAVAWNPSITGTKTEDTYLIDGDNRIVVTEASDAWPRVTVTAPLSGKPFVRPDILVR